MFQAFNLVGYLSAEQNVALPLAPLRLSRREKARRAMRALEAVGVADRAAHLPGELSGGQSQRVAIARAIVNEPDVVFADEPTGNLDSRTKAEIMELFASLNRRGQTLIMVTHDPAGILAAGRSIRMQDGRIQEAA